MLTELVTVVVGLELELEAESPEALPVASLATVWALSLVASLAHPVALEDACRWEPALEVLDQ